MGVPLLTPEGVALGFVYVDDRGKKDRFAIADLDFLSALAHLTAVALQSAEQYQRVAVAAEALSASIADDSLIGDSEPMVTLKREIQKYAAAGDASVLVRGESGTGKELVARLLHQLSPRSDEAFVALNCAAIPDTMVESEMFGHAKGAFTGATRDKRGKFLLADQGTLFLDEIGDLSLAAQAKLLRAIEEGEIHPLGTEKTVRVDVRIVAATHKDLLEETAAERFREDLYYRLNVVEIEVPPLRVRGSDVARLANIFRERAALRMSKPIRSFSEAALDVLCRYPWPGNVRELENEIERAVIIADGPRLDVGDLSSRVTNVPPRSRPASDAGTLAEQFAALEHTERELVVAAFRTANGNVSKAARLLGITRIMLKRRLERFGIGGADA
jgi:Nif-specific regulatory protein